jgi:hypothetical protein
VPASCGEAYAVLGPSHNEPIAVVLDLMQPHCGCSRCTRLDEPDRSRGWTGLLYSTLSQFQDVALWRKEWNVAASQSYKTQRTSTEKTPKRESLMILGTLAAGPSR